MPADRPRIAHRPAQLAYDYTLFSPGDATSPKVCRDFVRTVLRTLNREALVMPATLCTSELITNVHLHTKGSAMLRILLTLTRLRVTVFDESPDPPVVAHPAAGVASGDRGKFPLVGPINVPTVIALLVPRGRQAHTGKEVRHRDRSCS
ncbi:ATP-binding protein [Streptomyces sp. BA2]|uniref:ATP-binding protein n=1 Tax=Streptomyces sp. BA2 TaxID=436595 RepID=UPI001F2AD139|nr:ATP-binding protein [Streptomyces sp. BA2]